MATTTYEDSQGTVVSFGGKEFKATKVSVKIGSSSGNSSSKSQIETSDLSLTTGSEKNYQAPPLVEPENSSGSSSLGTVSIDFIGLERPTRNVETAIDLGDKLKIKGTAKCTDYQLDAQVNDIIRGSANFDLITLT